MTTLEKPSGLELIPRAQITATGTIGALNAVIITAAEGGGIAALDLRGTFVATIEIQGTVDGTNYVTIPIVLQTTGLYAVAATVAGIYLANIAGYATIRARCTAYTSGSALAFLNTNLPNMPPHGQIRQYPAHGYGRNLSAANTAGTLTIAAGGIGLYCYLTSLLLTRNNESGAAVAAAAAIAYTTTQLNSAQWRVCNGIAAWTTVRDLDQVFGLPIKAQTANTAVTIVGPAAGAGVTTEIVASFYYAP